MNRCLMFLLVVLTVGNVVAQSTLHTVEDNGPRNQRINIVFLSEGYTAGDMPNFAEHVNAAMNYLFSREPWQQYRSYCNVFRIEIASNQSGCDNGADGGTRDTYFNTGFNTESVPQLLTFADTGQSRAFTLLNQHVPEYDMPFVLVNDPTYGGSGGPIAIASIHSLSAQIVEHEIGHSFANLADEYDIDYPSYTPSEKPNNTAQTVRSLIKWNAWIDATTPVATPETPAYDTLVGLFEGSMYRTTGWYRPHNNSLMRNLSRPVGSVNREQFVLSIYNRVDPLDGWNPAGTSFSVNDLQNLSFSVTPKQPTTGALQVCWFIDGTLQAGATGNNFQVMSNVLGNGTHMVRCHVTDLTSFVRNDPGLLLSQDVTWTIMLCNQQPQATLAVTPAAAFDSSGPGGGPFSPASATYSLSNTADTSIDWTASANADWVALSASGGTLDSGAHADVVVSLSAKAESLLPQSYTATLTFTDTTNNNGNTSRDVSLNVSPPPPVPNQISLTGGNVVLRFWGIPGTDYHIERSIDLVTWIPIGLRTAPANGIIEFTDTSPPAEKVFYRTATP